MTDPPYGIREKAKKVGSKDKQIDREATVQDESDKNMICRDESVLPEQNCQFYWQSLKKTKYMLGEIFNDLINFAAKHLNENGRLTFWMPVFLEVDRSVLT